MRDHALDAIATVLRLAAIKARGLSDTGTPAGCISKETALAHRIDAIADEFHALMSVPPDANPEPAPSPDP